jgi:hypothetical protein
MSQPLGQIPTYENGDKLAQANRTITRLTLAFVDKRKRPPGITTIAVAIAIHIAVYTID